MRKLKNTPEYHLLKFMLKIYAKWTKQYKTKETNEDGDKKTV